MLLALLQAFRGAGAGRATVTGGRALRADLDERRKRMFGGYDSDDSNCQKTSRKKQKRTLDGKRWITGPMPATVAVSQWH